MVVKSYRLTRQLIKIWADDIIVTVTPQRVPQVVNADHQHIIFIFSTEICDHRKNTYDENFIHVMTPIALRQTK